MILRNVFYLIIGLTGLLLTSCSVTHGDYISSSLTRLSNDSCVCFANSIPLYFENEKINFEYDKIGFVEAISAEYSSNEAVLNHLKYQAWKNCANAIIDIKISYKERETGLLFSDKESQRYYTSTVFTGLAVKIKNDSLINQVDTVFVQKVREDYQELNQEMSEQLTVSFIGTIGCIILVIIMLYNK